MLVHFRPGTLDAAPNKPYRTFRCIPAVITRSWSETMVNLVVLPDGSNDLTLENVPNPLPVRWETSVHVGPPSESKLDDGHTFRSSEWHTLEDCDRGQFGA